MCKCTKNGDDMPRPKKKRCVCPLGEERRFSTDGNAPALAIRADEVEALRLCDLEELSQQEAATRMGVSRGTLQRLLYSAHRQIAFALVCGRSIHLDPPTEGRSAQAGGCGGKCRFCRNFHCPFLPLRSYLSGQYSYERIHRIQFQ